MRGATTPTPTPMPDWWNSAADKPKAGTTHYQVLGVRQGAGEAAIKQAYHTLSLTWHPDRNKNGKEVIKYIMEANATLSDPKRRQKYDDDLAATAWSYRGQKGGQQEVDGHRLFIVENMLFLSELLQVQRSMFNQLSSQGLSNLDYAPMARLLQHLIQTTNTLTIFFDVDKGQYQQILTGNSAPGVAWSLQALCAFCRERLGYEIIVKFDARFPAESQKQQKDEMMSDGTLQLQPRPQFPSEDQDLAQNVVAACEALEIDLNKPSPEACDGDARKTADVLDSNTTFFAIRSQQGNFEKKIADKLKEHFVGTDLKKFLYSPEDASPDEENVDNAWTYPFDISTYAMDCYTGDDVQSGVTNYKRINDTRGLLAGCATTLLHNSSSGSGTDSSDSDAQPTFSAIVSMGLTTADYGDKARGIGYVPDRSDNPRHRNFPACALLEDIALQLREAHLNAAHSEKPKALPYPAFQRQAFHCALVFLSIGDLDRAIGLLTLMKDRERGEWQLSKQDEATGSKITILFELLKQVNGRLENIPDPFKDRVAPTPPACAVRQQIVQALKVYTVSYVKLGDGKYNVIQQLLYALSPLESNEFSENGDARGVGTGSRLLTIQQLKDLGAGLLTHNRTTRLLQLAEKCGFTIESDQAITFLPDRVVPVAAQQNHAEPPVGGGGRSASGAITQLQPQPQPQPQPKPPGLLSYIVGLLCQINPLMAAAPIAMLVLAAIVNLYSKTPLPITPLSTNTSTNSPEL